MQQSIRWNAQKHQRAAYENSDVFTDDSISPHVFTQKREKNDSEKKTRLKKVTSDFFSCV